MVVPDVPVTLNVAVPFGVPVFVVPGLLPAQPVKIAARVTIARHVPSASRRFGASRSGIIPAARSAASIVKSPRAPHGHGVRFVGDGGTFELAVPNVSVTGVPVITGVTGFGLNEHVDFAGAPTQLSVKVPLEPKTVRLMGTLCPATTVGILDTRAKPATAWLTTLDALELNVASPP